LRTHTLSHSDLRLSIATAQWKGFAFSKDLVLKAGLVMTNANDIRFRVENFNQANMASLDQNWESIERALQLAAKLLARFGFSALTLSANSVLIPIADYL
jgi:hypothetical protein